MEKPAAMPPALRYETTASVRWRAFELVPTDAGNATGADERLRVFADQPRQVFDGFGGTFNELGWDALQSVSPSARERIMRDLFDRDGANLAFARTPIGASDYALSYYSYCDVKNDYTMRDFSIARDRYILIPYIKEALKIRPDLKIWASPWTPPAWMKINQHYTLQGGDIAGRTGGNEMDKRKNVMGNATAFNMQVGYLQAYALYFAKYVQAYRAEGIPLWAIMPQNEIAWSPNWPCCTWRAEDLALFIGKYLGPRFEQDGIDAAIWLGTVNYPDPDYVRTVLKNPDAARFVQGVGLQWSGSEAIPAIRQHHPTLPLMQTENMCGEHENDWSSLLASWKSVVHYLGHGVGSYMYWNMVLDETGKSAWGWPQNSMIVIDRASGGVRHTDEYFLIKHLARFVSPGSRVLPVSAPAEAVAFRSGDDGVVVTVNPAPEDRTRVVEFGGEAFAFTERASSINTLHLPGRFAAR